jgi:hypothetical protein
MLLKFHLHALFPIRLPDSQLRTYGTCIHTLIFTVTAASFISTTPMAHHINSQAKPNATIPKAPATRNGPLVIIGTAAP